MRAYERQMRTCAHGDLEWDLNLKADIRIKIVDKKNVNLGDISINSLNKKDLLKIKEVKKEINSLIKAREEECDAHDALVDARGNLKKFKKKGKRARTEFTRELMKNSPEGQAMLAQLDAIKKNTRKLLK